MTERPTGVTREHLDRLRRRKVVQWGLVYVAAAWGFLQGLEYVSESFSWPSRCGRSRCSRSLIGLPIVLVLAWYHGDRGQQRITTPSSRSSRCSCCSAAGRSGTTSGQRSRKGRSRHGKRRCNRTHHPRLRMHGPRRRAALREPQPPSKTTPSSSTASTTTSSPSSRRSARSRSSRARRRAVSRHEADR